MSSRRKTAALPLIPHILLARKGGRGIVCGGMGRIPEETVQQVIAASDIVAVIGSYFPLRRAGTAFKALCPFHSERTPSFQVNPARQIFKCFGCGAGGSVVKFVELHEHVSFPDAIRRLAERAGIAVLEEAGEAASLEGHRQRKELLALHREAAEWFHQLLLTSPEAEPARRYWKSRGLEGQAARRWKIGFAPPHPTRVLEWAEAQKISERQLVEGGFLLFGDEEEGGRRRREPWFRFAGRLMFPICNEQSEVIAFSGRILEQNDQVAKYLNSPETPIFNKGRVFFGLDRARRSIAKLGRSIICEGQLDLITCVEAGVENMVAPLGTALTPHHARRLAQLADQAVLCFDPDTAGIKAAGRAFRELAHAGVFVRVAELPPGTDPDSLVRTQGVEAFRERIDQARSFFDFQLGHLTRTSDLTQVRERLRVAAEVAAGIACLSEKAAQEDAINQTATQLAVPTTDVRRLVVRAGREAARDRTGSSATQTPTTQEDAPLVISSLDVRLLCRLALTDGTVLGWLRQSVEPVWLAQLPETEFLVTLLGATDLDPEAPTSYVARLPSREQACASDLLADPSPTGGIDIAKGVLLRLKAKLLEQQIDQAQARMRSSALASAEVLTLTEEFTHLVRQLRETKALARVPSALTPF